MSPPLPWWRPERFARRADHLRARAAIKQAVRGMLIADGFLEVETPILQVSPGNETHISAFATQILAPNGGWRALYLHSSPEFACKKLLAAGVDRLFTMTPVFRNRERGRLHHPEFTMLEWYRAAPPSPLAGEGARRADEGSAKGETFPETPPHPPAAPAPSPARGEGRARLEDLIEDTSAILRVAATAAGTRVLRHRGAESDPFAEPEILSVVEAFQRHAGIDLAAMLPDSPDGFVRLAEAARALGQRVADDDTWSDLFSKILSAEIEPRLGLGRPTFLTRYPAREAALARLCPDDPRFAERFELYACGVELANAFGELTDAAEQRRRFDEAEAERRRIYGETYPIDTDFLDALASMPEAAGIALGFDRLVMLATGAETIEDVLWAPVA